MTKQHRQESLCRSYVHAVAAQAGLLCSRPDPDYGIDLSLRAVTIYEHRRRDWGTQLDLQLRSTTRATVTDKEVSYDLHVDTFNDLRESNGPCPRILVVLVMPADETRWLEQTPDQLMLRRCAYWISLAGFPPTTAASSIRIGIPLANVFSVEALSRLMQPGDRKE